VCHYNQAWTVPLPGGGKISYESSDGLLRIQTHPQPAELETLAVALLTSDSQIDSRIEASVVVKYTGTVKGYGAYWMDEQAVLPKHTFLGFYRGIARSSLDDVVEKNSEYIMTLDGGKSYVDGYERAQDRSVFSPVHLNHEEASKANCLRMLLTLGDDDEGNNKNSQRECAFFASRDIEYGEELTFDYGGNYWRGRESEKI
jgi:hypothetical protein